MHDTRPEPSTISLILPAYNEAAVIANAVAEANEALSQVAVDYEIIVVDDGSTDATAAIVGDLSKSNDRVRLVSHDPNQGYGAAIRSGFAAAEKELVVFTDADCQFDLTELDRFVLLSGRYDMVCGYRIDRKDTPLRCLYSKVYNLLVRTLLGTGVRDVDCALKMFHRDVAKRLTISGNGFLVNSEILVQARQQGRSVVEVGVSHRPRTLGQSTVSVRHIPEVLTLLVRYWWNEVQFPVNTWRKLPACDKVDSTLGTASWKFTPLLLLLVAAIFMLTNLGYPLIDRDETRYAEIPREMIATGNWVLPQLNFQTYYDKPPLLYWLCAISFKLFGISETSARLVPALAALATLASTMFFGSRIFDRRIGLFAGVVLLLSVGFAFTSRYLLLDGVLSLFVSLSLFTAYEAIRGERLKLAWWIASGVCIGLAFLTKGPIAIVLWLPPVFAMAWLSEAHAKPRWWQYGILASVAATIAVPWFVLVHQQDPTFLIEFFYKHNVARFAGDFHPKPFWYFVPVLLVAGHPWSFLTIPYGRFLFGRAEENRSGRSPAVGFLLLWSVWTFVFFSMSKCKLPTYLLPAAPSLALMIGHYLGAVLRNADDMSRHFFARFWSARTATATTCFAGLSLDIFVMVTTSEATVFTYGWAMIWTSLLVTSLLLISDRHQAKLAWGTSTSVAFLFAIMAMHQMVPAYSRSQTLFGESSTLAEELGVEPRSAIATVDHEFSEVPFYLNRRDIPNFEDVHDDRLGEFVARSGSALLIVDDRIDARVLLEQLPETTKLAEVARRGSAQIFQATMLPTTPHLNNKYHALLRGLLYCPACNRSMVHNVSKRGVNVYRYYTCLTAIRRGRKHCPTPSLPAATIEDAVVGQVRSIASNSGLRRDVLEQALEQVGDELAELKTQRSQLQTQLSRAEEQIQDVVVRHAGTGPTRLVELHDQCEQTRRSLSRVDADIERLQRERVSEVDVNSAFADFDNVWNALSSIEKSEVLSLLVSRIEFDAGESSLSIEMHPGGIKSLATNLLESHS